MQIVLELESELPKPRLPKVLESPYRPALIKFLNLYAKDSVEHAMARVHDPAFWPLFRYILKSPDAGAKRSCFVQA